MGDTAVFILVTSSLTNILPNPISFVSHFTPRGFLTDFVTDTLGKERGWKLNTPFESSTGRLLLQLALLSRDTGLASEFMSAKPRGSVVL